MIGWPGSFGWSYFWLTERAIAARRKRLDSQTPFAYPDLPRYSKDVAEIAESPETFNGLILPEEAYPKYAHLCSEITDGYTRPVFSKCDQESPCVARQANKAELIDFNLTHCPSVRDTRGGGDISTRIQKNTIRLE